MPALRSRLQRFAMSTLALGVVAAAGTSVTAQQPETTVVLRVQVTTPPGAPLTADDFLVRINNRPQVVRQAETEGATTEAVPSWPAPYATNTGTPSRVVYVLVDGGRLDPTHQDALRTQLERLTTTLQPQDRLGLITLAGGPMADVTTAHARVVETLAVPPRRVDDNDDRADQITEQSLALLARAAAAMDPGQRITFVFVTAPFRMTSALRRGATLLAETLAARQIDLLVAAPGMTSGATSAGVNAFASITGARVLDDRDWALARERTVALTVTTTEALDRTNPARLIVTPRRPGLLVRHPPFAPRPTGAAPIEALRDMLRDSRTFTDLPLRMAAYAVRPSDSTEGRLLILAETIDPARRLQWAEFALITSDGRIAASWTERDAAARPLLSGILAPEGSYRLRLAASELAGRRGTVDVDVDTRLTTAGVFRMSDLMFGQFANDTFQPQLQPTGTTLAWYAEVYGILSATTTVSARFDLFAAPDAPAVMSGDGKVFTSPEPDRRAVTGTVDLTSLPAGSYQARVTLLVNGAPAGTVTRTLRHSLQSGR
jgi:hypothetical protein